MDTKQKINQKCYPAHIRPFCPEMGAVQTIQTVEQHCRNTAAYAQRALEPLGLGRTGYLAGLIHDAGKFTEAFRDYLTRSAHGEAVHRGSVNHTFAGVQLLLNQYHSRDGKNGDADWVSELLSVAVGSHHGLFDCVDEQGKNGFAYRKNKTDNGYEEAMEHFLQNCADIQELDALFAESVEENSPLLDRIGSIAKDEEEMYFYGGLLARLLLSAVIDGDRRDTAEFMNGTEFPVQRDETACKKMWEDCLHHAEEKISRFPQNTEIAKARMQISEQCRAFAEHPGGIYRLNVPTGGGKTLSSLRYALAHAAKWGKKHIIFTSPLLSILEQNAAVIREYVGNDSLILEHHSNVIQSEETELLDNRELLTETYDMPIIVTTLVQLLNTLFSGKTTAIRRFHALCESVIVIDEVQTVPNHMLSLFTLAVNFLTRIGGATVILCSATQPCMEDIDHPLLEDDHNILDMVPYHPEIWAAFRRTEIQDVGSLNLDGIAAFARSILGEANSLLIICNKKQQAQELFQNLRELDGACYHLSAGMCIAHRRAVLEEIRGSLEKGMPTVCVSTQLIEAGVDISFARVLRLSAGMDSVVQAAGRCNRNGEAKGIAPVYLVQCETENLSRLPDIQRGKDATLSLLAEYRQHPEQYDNNLASDAAIGYYYHALYHRMEQGYRDYPVEGKDYSIFSLLAQNKKLLRTNLPDGKEYQSFYQAFKLAGSLFHVFEEDTVDALVSYGEGDAIRGNLSSARANYDAAYVKEQIMLAKPYTVSLYRYQVEALLRQGALELLRCGVYALTGHYDKDTGFCESSPLEFLGV